MLWDAKGPEIRFRKQNQTFCAFRWRKTNQQQKAVTSSQQWHFEYGGGNSTSMTAHGGEPKGSCA
jgi:hypothetical protein